MEYQRTYDPKLNGDFIHKFINKCNVSTTLMSLFVVFTLYLLFTIYLGLSSDDSYFENFQVRSSGKPIQGNSLVKVKPTVHNMGKIANNNKKGANSSIKYNVRGNNAGGHNVRGNNARGHNVRGKRHRKHKRGNRYSGNHHNVYYNNDVPYRYHNGGYYNIYRDNLRDQYYDDYYNDYYDGPFNYYPSHFDVNYDPQLSEPNMIDVDPVPVTAVNTQENDEENNEKNYDKMIENKIKQELNKMKNNNGNGVLAKNNNSTSNLTNNSTNNSINDSKGVVNDGHLDVKLIGLFITLLIMSIIMSAFYLKN